MLLLCLYYLPILLLNVHNIVPTYLQIQTVHYGASIWVDGELRGRAPIDKISLSDGLHYVKIKQNKALVYERWIWLNQGDTTYLRVQLKADPSSQATASIRTTHTGSKLDSNSFKLALQFDSFWLEQLQGTPSISSSIKLLDQKTNPHHHSSKKIQHSTTKEKQLGLSIQWLMSYRPYKSLELIWRATVFNQLLPQMTSDQNPQHSTSAQAWQVLQEDPYQLWTQHASAKLSISKQWTLEIGRTPSGLSIFHWNHDGITLAFSNEHFMTQATKTTKTTHKNPNTTTTLSQTTRASRLQLYTHFQAGRVVFRHSKTKVISSYPTWFEHSWYVLNQTLALQKKDHRLDLQILWMTPQQLAVATHETSNTSVVEAWKSLITNQPNDIIAQWFAVAHYHTQAYWSIQKIREQQIFRDLNLSLLPSFSSKPALHRKSKSTSEPKFKSSYPSWQGGIEVVWQHNQKVAHTSHRYQKTPSSYLYDLSPTRTLHSVHAELIWQAQSKYGFITRFWTHLQAKHWLNIQQQAWQSMPDTFWGSRDRALIHMAYRWNHEQGIRSLSLQSQWQRAGLPSSLLNTYIYPPQSYDVNTSLLQKSQLGLHSLSSIWRIPLTSQFSSSWLWDLRLSIFGHNMNQEAQYIQLYTHSASIIDHQATHSRIKSWFQNYWLWGYTIQNHWFTHQSRWHVHHYLSHVIDESTRDSSLHLGIALLYQHPTLHTQFNCQRPLASQHHLWIQTSTWQCFLQFKLVEQTFAL
jgi:hypothetical protein